MSALTSRLTACFLPSIYLSKSLIYIIMQVANGVVLDVKTVLQVKKQKARLKDLLDAIGGRR